MKQPKVERRPLCPLAGFQECRGERCMIWDDDWQVCSLNSGSLYSMVRAAVCDAAVEVAKGYGRPLPSPAMPAPPSPEGEGFRETGNRGIGATRRQGTGETGEPGTSSVTALCTVPPSPAGEGLGTTAYPYCGVRLFKRSASLADTEV